MYIIKQHQTTVTLFCRDGRVWHYPSLNAARKQLGLSWISINVAAEFCAYSHAVWRNAEGTRAYYDDNMVSEPRYLETFYWQADFIMRDDAGRPVTHATFGALTLPTQRPGSRYSYRRYLRFLPVPGTGNRHGRRRHGREISYANALRGLVTFKEEGEVAPRPKRAKTLVPDWWDDYYSSARGNRSWKQYRKTQWKQNTKRPAQGSGLLGQRD
jgi:hypothetical protein